MARNTITRLLRNKNCTIPIILDNIERCQVHELNRIRKTFGEYHHLFPVLRKCPEKFKQYMRMKVETFDHVLLNVQNKLKKKWYTLHQQPILPEEQLVITIR